MADLYEFKTDTGVIVPDTADIKAGVESEYKAALGDDLDLNPSTPQGRLIAAETDARAAVLRFCALMANQINPDMASGTFLDAVAALSGIERIKAYGTTVSATIGGVPGSVIPAGSQAKTGAGDIFYLENAATIGGGGTVSATFVSQETGPVPCPSGSLEQIEALENSITARNIREALLDPDGWAAQHIASINAQIEELRKQL